MTEPRRLEPVSGPGTYVGSELNLFALAHGWKDYVRGRLAPHITGRALEVGAGLGAFTRVLAPLAPAGWTCLEPDSALLARIATLRQEGAIPANVDLHQGTLADLPAEAAFDTVLYLDVLEHIADDRAEVAAAAAHLAPGGKLIVLSPAFQFVFSPFDAAIGHFRRYTRASLARLACPGLSQTDSFYLDSLGLTLSFANRAMLRADSPTEGQIAFWDRRITPISRLVDPLFGRLFGRSVIMIWQRA